MRLRRETSSGNEVQAYVQDLISGKMEENSVYLKNTVIVITATLMDN
jgi:hypothetical protein